MILIQHDLFGEPTTTGTSLPTGFRYAPEILSKDAQDEILETIRALPFKPFDFHGFEGKRKVISFGWKFDFDSQTLRPADPFPDFLLPVREIAAKFAEMEPTKLQQALITEYSPGAPIGWHRDKMTFGRVVGVSLLSSCTFRFRRRMAGKWERRSISAAAGSAYLLSGPSRTEWEHSIPPVEQLRYSITFRELA
ncbi:alpha-ketoglutarate-dependent dioxygenase AlkB [Rhizobium grahamii]|uniref:alpha-ketoglutarate-dependent dioxygenase AlkB n=1 Tax=Rhizobium grahamii TaxID=1120045 RepID=UPI000593D361